MLVWDNCYKHVKEQDERDKKKTRQVSPEHLLIVQSWEAEKLRNL